MVAINIVSILLPPLLCRATTCGILAVSDILMLALIVLAVLVPAIYAGFCRVI
jgi:hypothetical protein